MAAVMCEVFVDIHRDYFKTQETIEERANVRLLRWGQFNGGRSGGGPRDPECLLGKIQEERVAAGQQGGANTFTPADVDEVERAFLRQSKRVQKILTEQYCEWSIREVKAKNCGYSPSGFAKALSRAQRAIYHELY